MRQFINGSDSAFAALASRARGACVRFPDQQMPTGTIPSRATVGFELDPHTGSACLFVEHGLVYQGPSAEIREWLATGEKRFDSFSGLTQWMRGHLRPFFDPTGSDTTATRQQGIKIDSIRSAIDRPGGILALDPKQLEALLWLVASNGQSGKLPS
jgi:hypothetical protein